MTMTPMKYGPFSVLGLKCDASEKEIANAYEKKRKDFHPDTAPLYNEEKKARIEKWFKRIVSAGTALLDPITRTLFIMFEKVFDEFYLTDPEFRKGIDYTIVWKYVLEGRSDLVNLPNSEIKYTPHEIILNLVSKIVEQRQQLEEAPACVKVLEEKMAIKEKLYAKEIENSKICKRYLWKYVRARDEEIKNLKSAHITEKFNIELEIGSSFRSQVQKYKKIATEQFLLQEVGCESSFTATLKQLNDSKLQIKSLQQQLFSVQRQLDISLSRLSRETNSNSCGDSQMTKELADGNEDHTIQPKSTQLPENTTVSNENEHNPTRCASVVRAQEYLALALQKANDYLEDIGKEQPKDGQQSTTVSSGTDPTSGKRARLADNGPVFDSCPTNGDDAGMDSETDNSRLLHDAALESVDGKPIFKCVCDTTRTFANMSTLGRHIRSQKAGPSCVCPTCGIAFKRCDNLKRHISTAHTILSVNCKNEHVKDIHTKFGL